MGRGQLLRCEISRAIVHPCSALPPFRSCGPFSTGPFLTRLKDTRRPRREGFKKSAKRRRLLLLFEVRRRCGNPQQFSIVLFLFSR